MQQATAVEDARENRCGPNPEDVRASRWHTVIERMHVVREAVDVLEALIGRPATITLIDANRQLDDAVYAAHEVVLVDLRATREQLEEANEKIGVLQLSGHELFLLAQAAINELEARQRRSGRVAPPFLVTWRDRFTKAAAVFRHNADVMTGEEFAEKYLPSTNGGAR